MGCNVARNVVDERRGGCTIAMREVFEVDTRSGENSETDVMRQSLTFHHIPCAERYAAELISTLPDWL